MPQELTLTKVKTGLEFIYIVKISINIYILGGTVMDEGNVLVGGVDKLYEIKEDLLELRGYQDNYEKLVIEEDKNDKIIKSIEKTA